MGWLTILPPLIAIAVVLWRKEVILALLVAILSAELLLSFANPTPHFFVLSGFFQTVDRVVDVFSSPGNTRVLLFSILIGAFLAFIRHSGGVAAFVERMVRLGLSKSRRQAGLLTFGTGIVLFIESNLSVLTAGIMSRGLFDRFGMSRERLAYIIDSTSAPVCIILMFNAWGAFVLGLLNNYELEDTVSILIGSVAYNFYAWLALALTLYTVLADRVHGPLKACEVASAANNDHSHEFEPTNAGYFLWPLAILIGSIFALMYVSGDGDITRGSGSSSILYATVIATIAAYLLMVSRTGHSHQQLIDIGFKGMAELMPLVCIVLLSMALGNSLKELGTGVFVSGLAGEHLPTILIVPMLFAVGGIISFTTGTSWGTFAILIPIGVPLIQSLGLPPSFVLAAILGGGIWGDHCSPISDTTAVSSIAAGCGLLDHVRTQLPYALVGGFAAFNLYVVAGFFVL